MFYYQKQAKSFFVSGVEAGLHNKKKQNIKTLA